MPRFKFSTSKDVFVALILISFTDDESFATLYSKMYSTNFPLAFLGVFHATRTDVGSRNWTLGWPGGPGPTNKHGGWMHGHCKYYSRIILDNALKNTFTLYARCFVHGNKYRCEWTSFSH